MDQKQLYFSNYQISYIYQSTVFLSSASFRLLLAEGECPEVRSVLRNVKHVLSHRVIYANFYEVVLPESSRSFSDYQCIRVEDLEQYPVSRLVHAFLEKYI